MGNYKDVETEFLERMWAIIAQCENLVHSLQENERYNHTLLVNFMLGLIVFSKESSLSHIPKDRLHKELKF